MNKDNQPKKTEQSAKTGKKSGKGRRVGRTIGIVLGTILLVTVLTSAIFVGIFMTYVNTSLKGHVEVDMSEYDQKVSTELYYQDPDTKELVMYQTLFGDENRIWVDFDSIPKNLRNATIAIEDKRFESHHGVDWHGTVRAVFRTLTNGNTQGGSTITQQLIKNVTGNNENTVKRKVTEVYRALALEKDYSKDEILEMYLNTIYLGNQCYGVQTASRTYFHKDVSELTLAECACLISITNNPSQYDPLRSDWTREQNRNRQLDVLDAMLAQEKIDQATYDAAKAEEVVFTNGYTNLGNYVGPQEEDEKPAVVSTANNSYFTDEVITDVAEKFVEVFGLTDDPADADGYVRTAFEKAVSKVYNGGYKIYTTQNPKIQDIAESVFENTNYAKYTDSKGEPLQAAITIVDPYTGDVVAMVGGTGAKEVDRGWNWATSARQPGSATKPVSVYAPALDNGTITAASAIDDYPVRDLPGYGAWPSNSGSGFRGLTSFYTALVRSLNTCAVRTVEELGTYQSYTFMVEKLGFTTLTQADSQQSGNMGLGGYEYGVTTEEMAAAYGAFVNDGVYTPPRTFYRVEDSQGNLVCENNKESHVAMKQTTAYIIRQTLKSVITSGTGGEARFSGMTIAGKTGTTSSNYDRYFVGYTPYYTAAVWIGYDQNASIRANGNPAAQLWKKVMSEAHENLPNQNFNGSTADMTQVTVCTRTGLLQGPGCTDVQTVWVAASNAPALVCDGHVAVNLCTESGKLATEYCPAECVQSVNAIDFTTENLTAAWGYERTTILLPLSAAEYEAYAAQQAADPTFVIPAGKPVQANDSGSVFSDLMMLGPCTLHQYVEPEPTPGEGYYDENGNWVPAGETDPTDPTDPEGSEEVSPERGTDFLNWLLNTAA